MAILVPTFELAERIGTRVEFDVATEPARVDATDPA